MSSAMQSHLTAVGYDLVVATTQKALNATMLQYLNNHAEKAVTTTKYWVWRKQVDPATNKKHEVLTEVKLDELLSLTAATNPFDISADADPDSDVGLQRLRFAQFALAMSITPGLPSGIAPQNMPNIIELGNESSSVSYNMLCSDLQVRSITYTGMDVSWDSFSQAPNQPWTFSCKVDLRMTDNTSSAFSKLPPDVQKEIKDSFQNEDAFSVQQLLFDLDNAGLETVPTLQITGGQSIMDPQVMSLINGSFLNSYFADMHARGQPLLHVAVVSKQRDESDFRATDMTMEVCQLLDSGNPPKPVAHATAAQQNLSTLNYLCMTKNKPMPSVQQLGWNWMSEAESHQYDGVISFSRNSFASMLKDQLNSQILSNCYIASASVWLNSGSIPQYACGFKNLAGGKVINPSGRDGITNWLNNATGAPTFNMTTAPNPMVMEWTWKQDPETYDDAGSPVTLGSLSLQPSYSCQVTLQGTQVTVKQHIVIYMHIMKEQVPASGNIVDRTLIQTMNVKADNGKLSVTTSPPQIIESSVTPGSNGFTDLFNHLSDEISYIQGIANLTEQTFQPAPVGVVQKFQFPGGKTFAFRNFQFSNNQDLTAAITYVDPN